jgi:hypothetical protein
MKDRNEMRALEFVAGVDEQRRLQVTLPEILLPPTVRVIVLVPEPGEEDAGIAWAQGIAREWAAELADPREDIYTLEDGEPADAAR